MPTDRQTYLTPRWQWLLQSHPSAQTRWRFRGFLFIEAASFYVAAVVHRSMLARSFEHAEARAAETAIGSVLLIGVIASWVAPAHARGVGLCAQLVAFFLTVLDLLMIAIGAGSHGTPDLVFNAAVLLLLSLGLFVVSRVP